MVILILLAILGITLGLSFGFRSQTVSATQITSIQALPLQPIGQLMAPPTSAPSTQQPQSCLKHCDDKIYVACPCGQSCDCSAAKKQSAASSSSISISQSSSSMSAWLSDYWHPLSSFYGSDDTYVDATCIALCYPDYTPNKVDCSDIDRACM